MSLELRYVAPLLLGVGASIVLAPLAVADPPSDPGAWLGVGCRHHP